ncbi:hypothetical protein KAR48_13865 [bacterium]|nr:hypothetical protein [bacterium]
MRLNKMCAVVLVFTVFTPLLGQSGALRLSELINLPSATMPAQGSIHTYLRMYPQGGFQAAILVGLSERFSIGVSYGGENIIGQGDVNLNPQPAVHIRYSLFKEMMLFPAIVLGFNSQGDGAWDSSLKRYAVKSRGFYAVASKNTSFLGGIGLHAGLNYSVEVDDGDRNINFFAGCHKWLNQDIVLLGEYDLAINDNSDKALGSGKGYLNAGVRWVFAERFFVEFAWKNILENGERVLGSSREIKMCYHTYL